MYQDNWDPCGVAPNASHWYQEVGEWTIEDPEAPSCDNSYLVADQAGAQIINLHPTSSWEQYVHVTFTEYTSGLCGRVMVGVDYNPTTHAVTSYYWVEYQTTGSKLVFGSNSGGVDTTIGECEFGGPGELHVYISKADADDKVTLSAGWYGDCQFDGCWFCVDKPTGKYVGLMDGPTSTGRTRFASLAAGYGFFISEHTDTPGVGIPCGDCDCLCFESCVPQELYYKITKQSGSDACCSHDPPSTGEVTFDIEDEVECTWNVNVNLGCSYHLGGMFVRTGTARYPLCEDWKLHDAGGYPGVMGSVPTSADICTCIPLYFQWNFDAQYPGSDYCRFCLEISDEPFV